MIGFYWFGINLESSMEQATIFVVNAAKKVVEMGIIVTTPRIASQ